MTDAGGHIRLAVTGELAELLLDRPAKRNAITLQMLAELEQHLAALEADPSVRAVVVAGAGETAFSAGADVGEWERISGADPLAMWQAWDRAGHRVLDRLAGLPVPVVAAIRGHALGGGLEVALAADLRIAADDAQLGLPEVRIGAQPGWGGTQRLAELVGPGRAKQLAFTGAPIDAATALSWGLVNEVVPADRLLDRARELGAMIAANAPIAVRLVKATIDGAAGRGTVLTLEGMAGALGATTIDGREGPSAFREKRQPRWTGR